MPTYKKPGVYIEEQVKLDKAISGVSTSVAGFLAVAGRGPVNKPIRLTSIEEGKKVFGDYNQSHPLIYVLDGFFKNGGSEAYVSRLAHYTNPADKATLVGQPAKKMFTGVGLATHAMFKGNVNIGAGVAIPNGKTVVMAVDAGANKTATFQSVAAVLTGVGGAFQDPVAADLTCDYKINGGPTKSVTIPQGSAGTVAGMVATLNALIEGVKVEVSGGQLKFTTDREGSSASIQFLNPGANWAAQTGVAAQTVTSAGPNNVSDSDAVTFAEIKAVLEAAIKTAIAGDLVAITQEAGTGFLVVTATTATVGGDSKLDLKNTSTAVAAIGLTGMGSFDGGPIEVGTASAAANVFQAVAGYFGQESPGTDGNNLSVAVVPRPVFLSQGAGNDLAANIVANDKQLKLKSAKGVVAGTILTVTRPGGEEHVIVKSITMDNTGAAPVYVVETTTAFANSFLANASAVNSQEFDIEVFRKGTARPVEVWPGLTMNPDMDAFAPAVLNDEFQGSEFITLKNQGAAFPAFIPVSSAGAQELTGGTSETIGLSKDDILGNADAKTGIHAFATVKQLGMLGLVPSANGDATVVTSPSTSVALATYAQSRGDCLAVLDLPPGKNVSQAISYRNNLLGADTAWAALYFPPLVISDIKGVGKNPMLEITPIGHIMGLWARVDGLPAPDGGVSGAPAGEGIFGKLKGVIKLSYDVSEAEHGELNSNGVNCIVNFGTQGVNPVGVCVQGARTLSTDKDWRYINTRRMMNYIEQSILEGTRWSVFRNNDQSLWSRIKTACETFLTAEFQKNRLPGNKSSEAFFVVCDESINTSSTVEEGLLYTKIGVALHRPAEFVIFQIGQQKSGGAVIES